ncbi:MAG TPA: hypothetical protein VF796_09815 [Humisphaera sp.]
MRAGGDAAAFSSGHAIRMIAARRLGLPPSRRFINGRRHHGAWEFPYLVAAIEVRLTPEATATA